MVPLCSSLLYVIFCISICKCMYVCDGHTEHHLKNECELFCVHWANCLCSAQIAKLVNILCDFERRKLYQSVA